MTKIDQKGRIILGDSMKSKDKGKKYIKVSNAQLMNLDEIVNNNTQNKQKEEYITEEVEL